MGWFSNGEQNNQVQQGMKDACENKDKEDKSKSDVSHTREAKEIRGK